MGIGLDVNQFAYIVEDLEVEAVGHLTVATEWEHNLHLHTSFLWHVYKNVLNE